MLTTTRPWHVLIHSSSTCFLENIPMRQPRFPLSIFPPNLPLPAQSSQLQIFGRLWTTFPSRQNITSPRRVTL